MKKHHRRISVNRPVIWVTGASRGIGFEVAKQFAFIGCKVALSARNKKRLNHAVSEINNLGGEAFAFQCDISENEEVLKTAKSIQKVLGSIDVLINNAGITVFKDFQHTTLDEFDDILDTNLEGAVACIKAVTPQMMKRKRGWIINIISDAAIKTFKGASAYTAAKAGLLAMSKVLREEFKKYKIKVVNVLPGPTETSMWSCSDRKRFSHRMMKPRSVAEVVLAIYRMPDDIVVDEIVIRPIHGDID